MSLNCLLKMYNCEYLIILFLILVLIVLDSGPQIAAVTKAVGNEYCNPIPVSATDADAVVVAIDDNTISFTSATLI